MSKMTDSPETVQMPNASGRKMKAVVAAATLLAFSQTASASALTMATISLDSWNSNLKVVFWGGLMPLAAIFAVITVWKGIKQLTGEHEGLSGVWSIIGGFGIVGAPLLIYAMLNGMNGSNAANIMTGN